MVIRRKRKILFLTFFNLASEVELGAYGKRVPVYPGMAFLKFIVEWANEAHEMPDEVYEKYLKNPKNFQLLAAYRNWKIEKENKEAKERSKPKKLNSR